MNCCQLNTTNFISDIISNGSNANINFDLSSLMSPYNIDISGIWRPAYYAGVPATWKNFNSINNPECPHTAAPYMGISNFATIPSVSMKDWDASNISAEIDWIVTSDGMQRECQEFQFIILFWYRYYDIYLENDPRMIPGVDLYVSDGDFAMIQGEPVVTYKYGKVDLITTAFKIKQQLDSAGLPNSNLNSKILASGPQIDWLTEKLSGPSAIASYTRDQYGLIIELLRRMSNKTYSDIGGGNYIKTKQQLIRKLAQKYGAKLVVPQNTSARLTSKFKSKSGPNVKVKLDGDGYYYSRGLYKSYDISVSAGDLTGKLEYTGKSREYSIKRIDGSIDYSTSGIHTYSLNDNIIQYEMFDVGTGMFNPNLKEISFHGLGGIRTESVFSNDKPYFLQDRIVDSMDSEECQIDINIITKTNTRYYLSGIDVSYLRSPSKPECTSFISDASEEKCNCLALSDISAPLTGIGSISGNPDTLNTPYFSYYYLPQVYFYGGLNYQDIVDNMVYPPHHPTGSFPKINKVFFPIDESCSYTVRGCGSGEFIYNIPFPAKLEINGSNSLTGIIELTCGDKTTSNLSGSRIIRLYKETTDPDEVRVKVTLPSTDWNQDFNFTFNADQIDYGSIRGISEIKLGGNEGFFHPNSGWISGPIMKSPLIPEHRLGKVKTNRIFYESDKFYNSNFLPGFNFLFSRTQSNFTVDGDIDSNPTEPKLLSQNQKNNLHSILSSGTGYIGVPNNNGGYWITRNWQKFDYNDTESPVLDVVEFKYSAIDNAYYYPLNDFTFARKTENSIFLDSYNGAERVTNYLQVSGNVILYNHENITDRIAGRITNISNNIVTLDISLPDSMLFGYISVINLGNTQISKEFDIRDRYLQEHFSQSMNQSVVIYRPTYVSNDKYYAGAKWGNLSYGAAKWYQDKLSSIADINRYNLFDILTSDSNNTTLSWSTPIKILGANSRDPIYYCPLSKKTSTSQKLFGYEANGDDIISQGRIDDSYGYIYIGPQIGRLEITVKVNNNNKNSYIELWSQSNRLDAQYVQGYTVTFIVNKENSFPYFYIRTVNNAENCFGDNYYISQSNEQKITEYSVKRIIEDAQAHDNYGISYYLHKPINSRHGIGRTDSILSNSSVSMDEGRTRISPLFTNSQYAQSLSRDYVPFLDLHILSKDYAGLNTITSPSGSMYFMDYVYPAQNILFNNLYNSDYFWIDIPYDNAWDLLTNNGYVIKAGIYYNILKKVEYSCDEKAKICSSRYPNDICSSTLYDLTESELFKLLGLSAYDRKLFEISVITFPQYCGQINYCCDPDDSVCLAAQTEAVRDCERLSGRLQLRTSCIDTKCVSSIDKIEGNITTKLEYYVIKLKRNLSPDVLLDQKKYNSRIDFSFFVDPDKIICSNSLEDLATNFYSVIPCQPITKECAYIDGLQSTTKPWQNEEIFWSRQYAPGTNIEGYSLYGIDQTLQLMPYNTNQPTPSSVIMENEQIYRKIFQHPNRISSPLFEYDQQAETHYTIDQTFNIKSTGCVPILEPTSGLATIKIDDWDFDLNLFINDSGQVILKSNRFRDLALTYPNAINQEFSTFVIEQKEYEDDFSCGSKFPVPAFDFNDPQKYFSARYNNRYEVIEVTDLSNPNNYDLVTRDCRPTVTGCSYTYYAGDAGEKDCCPSGSYVTVNAYNPSIKYCVTDTVRYGVAYSGTPGCNTTTGKLFGDYYVAETSGTKNWGYVNFPNMFNSGTTQSSGEALCDEYLSGLDPEDIITYTLVENKTDIVYMTDPYEIGSCATNANKIATYENDAGDADCGIYPCIAGCSSSPDYATCVNNCYKTRASGIDSAQNKIGLEYTELNSCTGPSFTDCDYGVANINPFDPFGFPNLVTSCTYPFPPYSRYYRDGAQSCGEKNECGDSYIDEDKIVTVWNLVYYSAFGKVTSATKYGSIDITASKCTRDYQKITVVKNVYIQDPTKYIETRKAYNKKYAVKVKDRTFDPNAYPSECKNKIEINLDLTALIYNDSIKFTLSDNTSLYGYPSSSFTVYRDLDKKFKCPQLYMESKRDDIFISDSVNVTHSHCQIGPNV